MDITLQYNDFNQLTKRFVGASWSVGTHRIEYDYDDNGNLIGSVEETYSGVWSVSEEWRYDWNPRDQMTRAMKWAGSSGSTNNVGSVEYQYCLACDGALSKRFVYANGSGASRGALESGQRYEYDGLNLLRVDEIYGSTLSESGPWRTLEISTHQPGQLGALLHKRVYVHTDNDATADQTKDFTYSYDPVGNVYSVFDGSGNEAYYFTQDAFGNALPTTTLGGSNWNAARADRILEHQTGKWIDEFTELYYFHARWYSSEVGRFVGRDKFHEFTLRRKPRPSNNDNQYTYTANSPLFFTDFNGFLSWAEGIFCLRHPIACAGADHCRNRAYAATEEEFGDRGGMNTPGDAYRHCVLACCLIRAIGAELAYEVLLAHENKDLETRPCAVMMDMYNNFIGMGLGASKNKSVKCSRICECNMNLLMTSPPCQDNSGE